MKALAARIKKASMQLAQLLERWGVVLGHLDQVTVYALKERDVKLHLGFGLDGLLVVDERGHEPYS